MKLVAFSHPCIDEVNGLDLRRRWSLFWRCGRYGQPRLFRLGRFGWEFDPWPIPFRIWHSAGRFHAGIGHCLLPHQHGVRR